LQKKNLNPPTPDFHLNKEEKRKKRRKRKKRKKEEKQEDMGCRPTVQAQPWVCSGEFCFFVFSDGFVDPRHRLGLLIAEEGIWSLFSFFGLADWGFCRKVVGEGGWVWP
jgi:hypothetical protein